MNDKLLSEFSEHNPVGLPIPAQKVYHLNFSLFAFRESIRKYIIKGPFDQIYKS